MSNHSNHKHSENDSLEGQAPSESTNPVSCCRICRVKSNTEQRATTHTASEKQSTPSEDDAHTRPVGTTARSEPPDDHAQHDLEAELGNRPTETERAHAGEGEHVHGTHDHGDDVHEGGYGGGNDDRAAHTEHTGHEQMFWRRFWVSLVLSVPVIFFSEFIQDVFGYTAPSFPGRVWVTPVLSVVIFAYGGVPFLSMARRELENREPGMMMLTSLAITVAFVSSIASLFLDSSVVQASALAYPDPTWYTTHEHDADSDHLKKNYETKRVEYR